MDIVQQEFEGYRALWEHMRDIVLLIDLDGTILEVNEAAIKAYGYSRNDFRKLSIADIRAKETLPDVTIQMQKAISEGATFETLHRREDGTVFAVEVSSRHITIDGKKALLSIIRDITHHKMAEAELHLAREALEKANQTLERKVEERTAALDKSQRFLRAIIDTVMDPIFVKDRQHRWVEANAAFWALLGGEAAAKGKTDYDFFPEEQAALFWAGDERVFAGERFDEEEKLLQPSGNELIIATKKVAFTMADGERGLVGVIRDVTHQREMEMELRRHHDHLAELVEAGTADIQRQRRLYETALSNTPDLIYIFDLQHRFTYANTALLKMWGRTWEDAIGKTCLELGYEPWHAEMHSREIEQVIRTKQPIRGEVPFTGTEGMRIYDYIFVPVIGEDGAVEAIAGSTRDVTDRKRSEEALREADQKKDEFLATLAHELRNPLAPIRNALYLLRSNSVDAAMMAQARNLMERQVEQMVRLVDDLMDVSRITRGKIELRQNVTLLDDVLRNAIEISEPLIQDGGHKLTVNLSSETVHIHGDSVRLSQVFANLLNNAAKYTEKGGRIDLNVRVLGESVDIEIIDSGIGIAPDMTARIFDIFSQVDNSLERARGGLGIGLTIVRYLLELHGGSISVASGGLGKGSAFTVHLPVLTDYQNIGNNSETDITSPVGCFKKVLVVDDNAASAQTLGWAIDILGCQTRIVHSAKDAIEAVKTFYPDVVLLDIGMPDMNGYELCRVLKDCPRLEKTVFIAQTGWGQKEHLQRSKEAGFNHHLVKPVDLKILEQILGAS